MPGLRRRLDRRAGFVESRVVIGHSIGFDLSMLEHETARAGLEWHKPRSLCVRLLAPVEPDQPDQSLDAIAARLGIAIPDRHSALGDARAAAEIFVALLPSSGTRHPHARRGRARLPGP